MVAGLLQGLGPEVAMARTRNQYFMPLVLPGIVAFDFVVQRAAHAIVAG